MKENFEKVLQTPTIGDKFRITEVRDIIAEQIDLERTEVQITLPYNETVTIIDKEDGKFVFLIEDFGVVFYDTLEGVKDFLELSS